MEICNLIKKKKKLEVHFFFPLGLFKACVVNFFKFSLNLLVTYIVITPL